MKHAIRLILGLGLGVCPTAHAYAASCDSLARLTLDNTKITVAQEVAAGAFSPPGPAPLGGAATQPRAFATLPAFAGSPRRSRRRPTPTSNSKSGCPRRDGTASSRRWATAAGPAQSATRRWASLGAGYATANTDTGHVGEHRRLRAGPSREGDRFRVSRGARDDRESKASSTFYGSLPTLAIWNGCSQGGRQGIAEAVRYPSDYDAIVAGAPAVNWLHLHSARTAGDQSRGQRDASERDPVLQVPGHSSSRARGV